MNAPLAYDDQVPDRITSRAADDKSTPPLCAADVPRNLYSMQTCQTAVLRSAASMGTGWGVADHSPPDDAAGIPFTGIQAAEATLQASSSAPPFPGLDVGRELSRLARRAADLETPPVFPGMPMFSAAGAGSGIDLRLLGQQIGGGWAREGGAPAGCGLPSAVLEDLEEVERACLQRESALKEEEQFVDTLGREDSPVAP